MVQLQKKIPVSDGTLHTTASVMQTHEAKPDTGGTEVANSTARSAAGEQAHERANRATSPVASGSDGLPNTPTAKDEVADAPNDAAEHATRLDALLSALSNLEIADQCPSPVNEDSEEGDALSDTEHSTNPASPTTPPYDYGDTDEEDEFVVGSGMQML